MPNRDFYTLPEISSQRSNVRWIENPQLRAYIDRLDLPNRQLIAYYLVTTTPSPENETCHNGCLTAHLAHISFGAGNYRRPHDIGATHKKLKQQYGIDDLDELYQRGVCLILQPREFLSNFDPDLNLGYWYPTFRKWVQTKFDRQLTDSIRAQKGMVDFDRTNLYLIRHATDAKVVKALNHQNYDPTTHPIYRALRSCLARAADAGQFDTTNPQAAHYAEVLALYRQRQLPSLGYDEIVRYLERLGTALRNYNRPPLVSTETPVGGDEDNRKLIDNITDDPTSPIDRMIRSADRQERSDRLNRFNIIVTELLQQLPSQSDRTLLLFHGLNFIQKDVALQLDCDQTTAMRRHNRILATLAQQIHLKIKPDAPNPALKSEELARIVTAMVSCCEEYYGNPLKLSTLDRLQQQPIESDRLLMLLHGLDLNPEQVSTELDCHQTTISSQHDRILTILAESICQQINKNTTVPPLSAQHYRIVDRAIDYCEYYYAELLEDEIQRYQNQPLQARIDRVQARWQIEFKKVTEPDDDNKIKLIGGAALVALLAIVKPPRNVKEDWLNPSTRSNLSN